MLITNRVSKQYYSKKKESCKLNKHFKGIPEHKEYSQVKICEKHEEDSHEASSSFEERDVEEKEK